jgi:hypothetical protein
LRKQKLPLYFKRFSLGSPAPIVSQGGLERGRKKDLKEKGK